ncbi:MAG: hypothetical protein KIT80_18145 [Chitinophagaceae bacterium]|nr:hypothetical protein [Chitinophagaceae bacterium]MCW5928847.1 hypothetical protein [Chitinophagaceae bacterium]
MIKLLFLLLLLGHISFGQTIIRGDIKILTDGIYGDNVNNSPNLTFNDRIKLVQIDKSISKIDIRLYRHHSLSNTKTLRRLFLIDTTWNAVEYNEWNKPIKIKKYNLKAVCGFDSLFLKLLSYNILILPNQSDLKSKMHKDVQVTAEGDTIEKKIHVLDGEGYTVEIKIENKFRVYQFDNPESYSRFYDNVTELKDYLSIVQTFEKFLVRKNNR